MSDYEVLPPGFRPKVLSPKETAERQAARAAAKGQDPTAPSLDASVLQTGPVQDINPVEQNFAEVTMPTPPPVAPTQPNSTHTAQPETVLGEVANAVKTGAEIIGATVANDIAQGAEMMQQGSDMFNNLLGGN